MKEIPLWRHNTIIATTKVDDEDFKRLVKFTERWSMTSFKTGKNYAYKVFGVPGTKTTTSTFMHNLIMLTPDGKTVDHIDRDGLNNQKSNLRLATRSQNQRNRGLQSNNTLGYRGVYLNTNTGKWQARIKHEGKMHTCGTFSSPEEAAVAYNKAAIYLGGEFAQLNVIPSQNVQQSTEQVSQD